MKIEQQVCTSQQAEKLKELGVTAPSLHEWWKMKYPASEESFAKNRANCLITPTGDNLDRFIMHYIDNENAQFHWDEGTHDGGQDHSRCELEEGPFPAYNVAELGEMLPLGNGFYVYPGYDCKMSILQFDKAIGACFYYVSDFRLETEAQSRAAMVIHLLENKLITVEEINKRTNP